MILAVKVEGNCSDTFLFLVDTHQMPAKLKARVEACVQKDEIGYLDFSEDKSEKQFSKFMECEVAPRFPLQLDGMLEVTGP